MFMSDIRLLCSALFIYVYRWNCSFLDDALVSAAVWRTLLSIVKCHVSIERCHEAQSRKDNAHYSERPLTACVQAGSRNNSEC